MGEPLTSGASGGAEIIQLKASAGPTQGSALEGVYRDRRAALVSFLTLRLGSPSEAEDVAQAAFMQLWSRREALKDDNLSSLLFTTARNLAVDALRRRKRSPIESRPGAEGDGVPDQRPSAERVLIARRQVSLVNDLLCELPPKCRQAFVSYKLRDQDYPQIAREMGVTESMVRKYVRRAVVHCVARLAELETWE